MRAFARVLLVAATAASLAAPAAAQDVSLGSCAGVKDVYAGPGGVRVGEAWVNPSGCVGPR
jgi:hypothetical protein